MVANEEIAGEIGLDVAKFKAALDSHKHKAKVEADAKVGNDAGINGTPGFVINGYYLSGAQPTPAFKKLTPVAHTLAYDLGMCVPFQQGVPLPGGYFKNVSTPVLSAAGSKSPAYMTNAQQAIAKAVEDGRYVVLDGQNHMVKASALAPVAAEFFTA